MPMQSCQTFLKASHEGQRAGHTHHFAVVDGQYGAEQDGQGRCQHRIGGVADHLGRGVRREQVAGCDHDAYEGQVGPSLRAGLEP